mgnify:CR=1 FL=1
MLVKWRLTMDLNWKFLKQPWESWCLKEKKRWNSLLQRRCDHYLKQIPSHQTQCRKRRSFLIYILDRSNTRNLWIRQDLTFTKNWKVISQWISLQRRAQNDLLGKQLKDKITKTIGIKEKIKIAFDEESRLNLYHQQILNFFLFSKSFIYSFCWQII